MNTKSMAILGLVLSFLVPVAGIIVSAIALKQFKDSGESDGKGLAIGGLVVGIIFTVLSIIIGACLGCVGALAGASASYY